MKKKVLICLFTLSIFLTGCNNKQSSFTMECTTKKENSGEIETQNVIIYNFNKDQIATSYSAITTQKFTSKETYKIYKDAQEQTTKNSQNENVTYKLKSNDKKKTLIFTMTLKNIDKNISSDEEKETLKVSTILKNNEKGKVDCKLKGINKNKLK